MPRTRSAYSPTIDLLVDSFDGGDPWGSAMGMAFAVAEVCEAIGLTAARDILDYRPSPLVASLTLDELLADEDTTYETDILAEAVRRGQIEDADLIRACRVLDRYLTRCKLAGRDY